MKRRKVFFVALTLASAVSLLAAAQTKKPGKPAAAAPAKKPASKAEDAGAAAPTKEEAPPRESAREAAKSSASESKSDAGRVFRFGEVEVEGRLKSPQIVYFLRRVRAEFAAGDLGHRSFMSELGETKYEPSF